MSAFVVRYGSASRLSLYLFVIPSETRNPTQLKVVNRFVSFTLNF